MKLLHKTCDCIRCKEIRNEKFDPNEIGQRVLEYKTHTSKEYFITFVTEDKQQNKNNGKLLAFLRLSLPKKELSEDHFIDELQDAAIIREVHVYGRALQIGKDGVGETQHLGLGKKLIIKAKEIASANNYEKLSVISAVGTRGYYKKRGFEKGELYQTLNLE